MQPTTTQTIISTSSLASQTADGQTSTIADAPVLLDAQLLAHVSGGTTTPVVATPVVVVTVSAPNGSW